MIEKRYFKCDKCATCCEIEADFSKNISIVCVEPFAYRTGGICGGGYTIPITIEQFELEKKKIKTCRNCKYFSEHHVKEFGYCDKLYEYLDVEDRKGNLLSNFSIIVNENFSCLNFEPK